MYVSISIRRSVYIISPGIAHLELLGVVESWVGRAGDQGSQELAERHPAVPSLEH